MQHAKCIKETINVNICTTRRNKIQQQIFYLSMQMKLITRISSPLMEDTVSVQSRDKKLHILLIS